MPRSRSSGFESMHPLLDDLVLAKCAGLPQHLVHEGRLAVVDVRDDGNVPDLHSRLI